LYALLEALLRLDKLAVVMLDLLLELPLLCEHLELSLLKLCGSVFNVPQLLANVLLDQGVFMCV
jgi:hypothetical protein